jgi:putative FmdB family regulatory protein
MPLYDWVCTDKECQEHFEKSIPLKEADEGVKIKCPTCGADSTREMSVLRSPSTSWKHWRL